MTENKRSLRLIADYEYRFMLVAGYQDQEKMLDYTRYIDPETEKDFRVWFRERIDVLKKERQELQKQCSKDARKNFKRIMGGLKK